MSSRCLALHRSDFSFRLMGTGGQTVRPRRQVQSQGLGPGPRCRQIGLRAIAGGGSMRGSSNSRRSFQTLKRFQRTLKMALE